MPQTPGRPARAGLAALALGAAAMALGYSLRRRQRRTPRVAPQRLHAALPPRDPKAVAYTRTRYLTALAGEGLALGFLVAASRQDRPVRLRRWAERHAPNPFLRDALFGGSLLTLSTAALLPYSFVSGHLVERAFGLSRQSAVAWLADAAKGYAVSLALGAPTTAGLYAFIRRSPERWWLAAGGASALLAVVLTNLAPLLIDPLFHRYTPLHDEPLRRRLEELACRAGLPVLGVFEADYSRKTTKANAYLTGIANTRRIVLTDTLLGRRAAPAEPGQPEPEPVVYSHAEIASVLAHELGHHHFGHIWKGILLGTVGTLGGFALADGVLRRTGAIPGYAGKGDVATLPALSLFLSLVSLAAAPAGAALSRAWERQCDRYALAMTNDPEAFIGVMRKLARQNLADPCPPAWLEALLYDHPSIRNRILMALEWPQTGGPPTDAAAPADRYRE